MSLEGHVIKRSPPRRTRRSSGAGRLCAFLASLRVWADVYSALVVHWPSRRVALGWDAVRAASEGAAAMDRHFRHADPAAASAARCLRRPILSPASWAARRAVFAYDERRARRLPIFQQLEMESNGKSVKADGTPAIRN